MPFKSGLLNTNQIPKLMVEDVRPLPQNDFLEKDCMQKIGSHSQITNQNCPVFSIHSHVTQTKHFFGQFKSIKCYLLKFWNVLMSGLVDLTLVIEFSLSWNKNPTRIELLRILKTYRSVDCFSTFNPLLSHVKKVLRVVSHNNVDGGGEALPLNGDQVDTLTLTHPVYCREVTVNYHCLCAVSKGRVGGNLAILIDGRR